MSDENPYSAPETDDELVADPELDGDEEEYDDEEELDLDALKFGGFLIRAVAKMVDLFLFSTAFLICFSIYFGVKLAFTPPSQESYELQEEYVETWGEDEEVIYAYASGSEANFTNMQGFVATLSLLISGAIFEWWTGVTPGKLIFGLRVIRAETVMCPTVGSALGRNIAMLFDGMFLGVPALFIMRSNAYNQRMGDVAAHTVVVKKNSLPEPLLVPPKNYLLCLVVLFITINAIALGIVLT